MMLWAILFSGALGCIVLIWTWGRQVGPARPGKVSIHSKEELSMSNFGYTFSLPAPEKPTDVKKRELQLTVAGVVQEPILAVDDPTVLISNQVVLSDEGEPDVDVSLIDTDAKGNASSPSAPFSFKVTDDIPPATPGQLGIASKVQID